MSESPARKPEETTSELLSDDALDQVNGGLSAPRDVASGLATGIVVDFKEGGLNSGVKAGAPQSALVQNQNVDMLVKF